MAKAGALKLSRNRRIRSASTRHQEERNPAPMADSPSPQDFVLNLLLSFLQAISSSMNAFAFVAITLAACGGSLCLFGWLIRTGRIPVSSHPVSAQMCAQAAEECGYRAEDADFAVWE